jgi:hypothetical protein
MGASATPLDFQQHNILKLRAISSSPQPPNGTQPTPQGEAGKEPSAGRARPPERHIHLPQLRLLTQCRRAADTRPASPAPSRPQAQRRSPLLNDAYISCSSAFLRLISRSARRSASCIALNSADSGISWFTCTRSSAQLAWAGSAWLPLPSYAALWAGAGCSLLWHFLQQLVLCGCYFAAGPHCCHGAMASA